MSADAKRVEEIELPNLEEEEVGMDCALEEPCDCEECQNSRPSIVRVCTPERLSQVLKEAHDGGYEVIAKSEEGDAIVLQSRLNEEDYVFVYVGTTGLPC